MAQEQFSLCWDNFHKNMSSGMHSLLETEDLVDVTLAIDGQYLKAHKMVLSVCSPYFRLLFGMNPCKHPIVFLKDVSFEVMSDLLTFMYQGEVQVNQENLATFIKTAEALQIKGLTGDNNEHDEIVDSAPLKRSISGDIKQVKRFTAPAPKKQKLVHSNAPTSTSAVTTSNVVIEKSEPSSCSEETVQFKVEAFEDQAHVEQFEQDSYADESVDESQADEPDYAMMEGEEEPQAGTSGNGVMEGQDCDVIMQKVKRLQTRKRFIQDGFVYHTKVIAGSTRYYKCVYQKRLGCQATSILGCDQSIGDLIVRGSHNHPPDATAEKRQMYLLELYRLVRDMYNLHLKRVYDHFTTLHPEALDLTPYNFSLTARMKRWRRGASLGSV